MKKICLLILFVSALGISQSCNRGVGCPAQDKLKAPMNKDGEYKKKATKSGLWSKKARKKMG